MEWYKELKYRKIIFGFIFLIISYFSLRYAFDQPCEISFGSMGEQLGLGLPKELSRAICMTSNFQSLLFSLIGIALIFPSIGAIVKGFTE